HTHVRRQSLPQRLEITKRRPFIRSQRINTRADRDVIAQRPRNERIIGITPSGERGQQHLLLDAKMTDTRTIPKHQERLTRIPRRRRGRPPQTLRGDQRLMMITREPHKCRGTPHAQPLVVSPSTRRPAPREPAR
ncbi:MAG TPA: hypothetical protein VFD88_04645, partial [Clostridia bacterium]|nr:hypothetical protein [Clostridia bacterium]